MTVTLISGVPTPAKVYTTGPSRPPAHDDFAFDVGREYSVVFPWIDAQHAPMEPPRRFFFHRMEYEAMLRVGRGRTTAFADVCFTHRSYCETRRLLTVLEVKPHIGSTGKVLRQFRMLSALVDDYVFEDNSDIPFHYTTARAALVVWKKDPLLPRLAAMFRNAEHFLAWDGVRLWRVPGNMETYRDPVRFEPIVAPEGPTIEQDRPAVRSLH